MLNDGEMKLSRIAKPVFSLPYSSSISRTAIRVSIVWRTRLSKASLVSPSTFSISTTQSTHASV